MPETLIGPVNMAGVELETWLLKFDKTGVCISPHTRAALLKRLDTVPDTPVILFSHGWNNEFGDATTLYAAFLKQLQQHLHKFSNGALRPLFVGVIWPSTWLSFDTGPAIAAEGKRDARAEADDALKRELAAGLPDPATRQRFYALLEAPQIGKNDAAELGELVAKALDAETAAGAADTEGGSARTKEAIVAAMHALQLLDAPAPVTPGDAGEGGTIDGNAAAPLQDAGFLDFLDPRRALRVASVYQMKDRAGTVGFNGVSALVTDILAHSHAPLHAVGHSYGAKVILSAIAAATVTRPLASVLLLEPAISHLCFAAQIPGGNLSGGYRGVLGKIGKSILMTYSANDFPLHEVFHRALLRPADLGEMRISAAGQATSAGAPPNLFAALGGYGPRGAGEQLREPLPDPGSPVLVPDTVIPIAYDGTLFKRVGGHGDVASPHTAWLLYSQMTH
jgi:hypothetical protein